jgi:hypothetical protein
MIEITNMMESPIQLVIKHKYATNQFQCVNIPGRGLGKNIFLLEDSRTTEYIDRAVTSGFITIKNLPD